MRGKTQGQATDILIGARLRVGRVTKKVDNWPPGTVVQQYPEPGARVIPGTAVNLWLVEPPPVTKIRVPDLTGQTQGQAAAALARLKLQLGRVTRVTSSEPLDTVVDQDPEPGTVVAPRTLVHLRIALEPVKRVKVPDLQGQTQRQAADTLEHADLKMGRAARQTSHQTPDTVVDQNPKPGRLVRPDFRVQVWLAAAPASPPAPLTPPSPPATSPPPLPAAPMPVPPSPGEAQSPSEAVMAKPPLPKPMSKVEVPNLVGKKRGPARQILLKAGLQEGEVATRKTDLESDTIIVQTPKPATIVLPGTPVVLVISYREPVRTGWPRGVILIGLLAILGGGYYVASRLIGRALLPVIQVKPKIDKGIQHLALDTPLPLDLEVRLKPVLDSGKQDLSVAGPIILEKGEKS